MEWPRRTSLPSPKVNITRNDRHFVSIERFPFLLNHPQFQSLDVFLESTEHTVMIEPPLTKEWRTV